MGLFDEPEKKTTGDGVDVEFDEDSKIRLFETQRREERWGADHLKRFLPVALVAIVIVAAFIYWMQPGVGDVVKPPKEVENAVYQYMDSNEHRSVREIAFYNCGDWYWVRILAEPRSALASVDHPENQYRLSVRPAASGPAEITALPDKTNDVPCRR